MVIWLHGKQEFESSNHNPGKNVSLEIINLYISFMILLAK